MTLINSDLGECLTPDPDGDIMPLIDMANIASGGHVGDEASIDRTIQLAKQCNVMIGAHPSYPDRANFGRASLSLTAQELFDCIKHQLNLFIKICAQHQQQMHYIKPHGALYHDMMVNEHVLNVICSLIETFDPQPALIVQAGLNQQLIETTVRDTGIQILYEAFADRAYCGQQLVPRSESGAMISSPEQIVEQYHQLSNETGFAIDTICFHSDHKPSQHALRLLKGI